MYTIHMLMYDHNSIITGGIRFFHINCFYSPRSDVSDTQPADDLLLLCFGSDLADP